jgi:hypothetical protein
VHTFDALSYVTSIERKPWSEVLHPHHLAYGPLGTLTLALSRALGYPGGAALPLQLLNATTGALGVTLFFTLVRRITQRTDIALTSALLLGGAYAYWYYAVEIEVYTLAGLFLIVCLDSITRLSERPTRRRLLALGLAQGGAILFHQTNALLCVPVLVALLMADRRPTTDPSTSLRAGDRRPTTDDHAGGHRGGHRGRVLWVYVLALGLSVGVPYVAAGVVVSGLRTWADFVGWMTEYARTGWWGGPITAQKWDGLGKGLADTLAQPGGAVLWALLAGLVVAHLRRLAAAPRPLVATLVTWLVVYGSFFFWWEPDNVEFWIASLPPALLLLALALRGERHWGAGVWLGLGVALATIGMNYKAITRRGDPATDLQRVIGGELGARSRPADVLLVPDGLLELYLPYYERHDNFLSLNQALFDTGNDWDRACATVRTRIDAAAQAGATALVADEVLHPPALLLQRHGLTQTQVDTCFAPYREALQPLPMPPTVPAYWRLPTGQERAEGAGWQFAGSSEGWWAEQVQAERFAGSWVFVPATDPALTSPLLQLEASRYRAIEIRMANGTAARDAQLFFAGPDGRLDEGRSVRWELAPTGDAVTYRVELAGQTGWEGVVTRLRLDPVGVGDGGEVRVEWVRLVGADG